MEPHTFICFRHSAMYNEVNKAIKLVKVLFTLDLGNWYSNPFQRLTDFLQKRSWIIISSFMDHQSTFESNYRSQSVVQIYHCIELFNHLELEDCIYVGHPPSKYRREFIEAKISVGNLSDTYIRCQDPYWLSCFIYVLQNTYTQVNTGLDNVWKIKFLNTNISGNMQYDQVMAILFVKAMDRR